MNPKQRKSRRQKLFYAQKGKCRYCKLPFEIKDLTFDHIVPRAHGGRASKKNLVLACLPCNSKKGARIALFDPNGKVFFVGVGPDKSGLWDPDLQAYIQCFIKRGWTNPAERREFDEN